MATPKKVAFIPARSGSVRIKDKNIQLLGRHPMIAYSIQAARDSGIFDAVICATDDEEYGQIATHYGAEVPFLRPPKISGSKSPDLEWVKWMLTQLSESGRVFDVFSILRPTSPFRTGQTIRRAWEIFEANPKADSVRAVKKCGTHPGKMWVIQGGRMLPLIPFCNGTTPWHSSQYAALPDIYEQNASLEIAWTSLPVKKDTIAGEVILPFINEGYEGFDVNLPEDFLMAESLVSNAAAELPVIHAEPMKIKMN